MYFDAASAAIIELTKGSLEKVPNNKVAAIKAVVILASILRVRRVWFEVGTLIVSNIVIQIS